MKNKANFDAIVEIAESRTQDDAWLSIERQCRNLGFSYAGIGIIGAQPDGVAIQLEHATSAFQMSFSDYQHNQLHLGDPSADAMAGGAKSSFLVEACQNAKGRWVTGANRVLDHLRKDDVAAHFATRIDIADVANFGFLCVGMIGDADHAVFKRNIATNTQFLQLAGMAFASIALRSMQKVDNSLLTRREKRVLALYAEGLTTTEIAESEHKSPATIASQLMSARQRLGARNLTHCVSIALSLGLISMRK